MFITPNWFKLPKTWNFRFSKTSCRETVFSLSWAQFLSFLNSDVCKMISSTCSFFSFRRLARGRVESSLRLWLIIRMWLVHQPLHWTPFDVKVYYHFSAGLSNIFLIREETFSLGPMVVCNDSTGFDFIVVWFDHRCGTRVPSWWFKLPLQPCGSGGDGGGGGDRRGRVHWGRGDGDQNRNPVP